MPDTGLSLKVGDRVVYPKQGLCFVTDIRTEEILGQRLVFVSLQFTASGAKVKVPQDKLEKNGVRRIASDEDIKDVIGYLRGDAEKASLNWKARKADNANRMVEGGLQGLAQVVKELQVLSELRPLPPKERLQYNDARRLLVQELSVSMGTQLADAEDLVDVLLFPVGKDRPKRSVEEFQALGGDDDFGIDDLAADDGGSSDADSDSEASGDDDETPSEDGDEDGGKKAKKKPAKADKKQVLSDFEPTEPMAAALPTPELKKKRGRPPKPKPEGPPPPPKKRGRPPKPKPEGPPPPPKKLGRPPKPKAAAPAKSKTKPKKK